MLTLTVLALLALAVLALALGRGEATGRHQRSRSGPVRGDGSGWTEEGLAEQFPGAGFEAGEPSSPFRGPEDDPTFLEHLDRLNRSNRPEPPAEA